MMEPSDSVKVESEEDAESLKEKLSRIPGPEYFSSRPGPGGKRLHYLSGESSCRLANEVFGTTGWSSTVKSYETVHLEVENGVMSALVSAVVRVTCLCPNKFGQFAFHEDVGTGQQEMHVRGSYGQCRAECFDKALKGAVTDGRKRALRPFGNATGLCVTDLDALRASLSQRKEKFEYEFHRKSSSVSRRSTPPPGYPGDSIVNKLQAVVPSKRRATEVERDEEVLKAMESADWDTFE